MRNIAVLETEKGIDTRKNILEKLPQGEKIVYFGNPDGDLATFLHESGIEIVGIPEEIFDHESRLRNFAAREMYGRTQAGFIHFVDCHVEITGDIVKFMDAIEEVMPALGLESWYNTVCDPCNYVLTRYNPRISLTIDEDDAKFLKGRTIHWCSNANTAWICVDRSTASLDDILLDEKFDVAMFYIIEFLAGRRNRKSPGRLHYMNMYPGIEEELGAFRTIETGTPRETPQSKMAEEDGIFRQLGIDTRPDMDMDMLISDVHARVV